MLWRVVGLIEVLVFATFWGIAAPAAVAAAFEALETRAATRHAAACTSYYAGDDRENNEASDDYCNNDRPPDKVSIGMKGMRRG